MSARPFAYRVALRLYSFYARRFRAASFLRGDCLTTRLILANRVRPKDRFIFP